MSQGSVLDPALYIIYTAALPVTSNQEVATYANDTAILASHRDPNKSLEILQNFILNSSYGQLRQLNRDQFTSNVNLSGVQL